LCRVALRPTEGLPACDVARMALRDTPVTAGDARRWSSPTQTRAQRSNTLDLGRRSTFVDAPTSCVVADHCRRCHTCARLRLLRTRPLRLSRGTCSLLTCRLACRQSLSRNAHAHSAPRASSSETRAMSRVDRPTLRLTHARGNPSSRRLLQRLRECFACSFQEFPDVSGLVVGWTVTHA